MLSGINPEQKYFAYEVYLLLLGTLQMVYSYYEYSDRKKNAYTFYKSTDRELLLWPLSSGRWVT